MGMTFTRDQQRVIDARERNLLVSAAAGSGKTAVLVERILSRITDKTAPVDIDELLIVTFTEAAASEMRERIGTAIEKQLEQNPGDAHLARQQTLLYNARITTIHSFCLFVIRNYFHRIGLEPDFRVGEEGEFKLLRGDVLKDVLEEYYQEGKPEFLRLAETLDTGKSDEKLKKTILTLYDYAMSAPWPKEWLWDCLAPYEVRTMEEFEELPVGKALLGYLKAVTGQWAGRIRLAAELSGEPDGPGVYQEQLCEEAKMLEVFGGLHTFGEYAKAMGSISFKNLPAARKFQGDMGKKRQIQTLRKSVKDSRDRLTEQYFRFSPEEMVSQLLDNRELVHTLIQVTIGFMEAYSRKKREKNLLDFSDMEHFALEILVDDNTKEPTQTALELRGQFAETMVDEYQDSNYVQETILNAVSREVNRFMVGDVKQSIYRFRMARPELFMEKYGTYTTEDSKCQKIDLSMNFRSRGEVLDTVNDIFYPIMGKDLGNVEYDKAAALYQGMTFPEPEEQKLFQTEVLLSDPGDWPEEEREQLEAVIIAHKIKELLDCQQVTDKETGRLRAMEYRDVVILVRSLSGNGQQMTEVLKSHGIPAIATSGTGYFGAVEVKTVLNFIRLLDNPRQDIPMTAALTSAMGGVTSEELAKIRIQFPEIPFYQSVLAYGEEGKEEALREKVKRFLQLLTTFRGRVNDTPIHELLYQVMEESGYLHYVHALPGGNVRRANLEMLIERAIAYEKTSYRGLFSFIRYINQLQKYQVDYGEAEEESAENAVRIMTIHKSKGLEFPVVFVAGMGKEMNRKDAQGSMVLHAKYGIGLDVTDLKRRVRIPSLSRRVLGGQTELESAGEELRVLYVALTRAKEKLILTGALKKAQERLEGYALEQWDDQGHMEFLTRLSAKCYWDWVLPPLIKKQYPIRLISYGELGAGEVREAILQGWSREQILEEVHSPAQSVKEEAEAIEERLSYCYPYEGERSLKTKLSVSELKHRAMDRLRQEESDTSYIFEEPPVIPYVPEFMAEEGTKLQENTGALRGTAMHRVLECLDFSKDADTLEEQIQEMVDKGRLGQDQKELVSVPQLGQFLHSPLAMRMLKAARLGKLYKEKPFVMGKKARELEPETGGEAMVLIQGIIDAFFEEEGELVLVDYKTDAVKTGQELALRYQAQMDLYREALERATGKKVKEKLLYSFKLHEVIAV